MISIVIPAYNEQSRIARTLDAYIKYTKHHNLSWHILVVLNGCTDKTEDILKHYSSQHNTISYITAKKKGKGCAIKEGFSHSLSFNTPFIGFVDADCATEPEEFHRLFYQLINQNAPDIAIGSRYMPESNVKRPFYKSWGRKIVYHPLLYILFGFSFYDIQCGAKLFTRSVIQSITPKLTASGWSIDPEILYIAKKQKYKIIEIPISWHDQTESKFTVNGGISMIFDLFRLRYQHR